MISPLREAALLLEKVKISLRISNDAFDDMEIKPLIEAAKKELEIAGVNNINADDPLIIRAVVLYCKANFGYDNPDSEKLMDSFNSIKDLMSQSGSYIKKKRIRNAKME